MKSLHIHELTVATIHKENMPPVDVTLFQKPPLNLTREQIVTRINQSLDELLKRAENLYQDQYIDYLNFILTFYITDKELYSVVETVTKWTEKNLVTLNIIEK